MYRRAFEGRRRALGLEGEYAPVLLQHRLEALAPVPAVAAGTTAADRRLVERIVAAYRRAAVEFEDDPSSLWAAFFQERQRTIHAELLEGSTESVAEILRNPAASSLFFGFDGLTAAKAWSRAYRSFEPAACLDMLLRFAEALAAIRLDHPETYHTRPAHPFTAEEVVRAIEERLGTQLSFPNPFPGEQGIASPRGVISLRAVWALYQAWRLTQLAAGRAAARVLEIGAGLGRTAFYARQFGLTEYTIVDLPFTSVSHAYFLGRTLGPDAVVLYGEDAAPGAIRILPPNAFLDGTERYDVVLNADSLTEMNRAAADAYWREIARRSSVFLSINHEANDFTARDVLGEATAADRFPCWVRPGYVEEIVRFDGG